MKTQKLAAIDELTSPLFRIMAVHNDHEANRRMFDMNVSAFHIGGGYLLSVAHVLKSELTFFRSMREEDFQRHIITPLSRPERQQFEQWYALDKKTGKRYLQNITQPELQQLVEALKGISYDTRLATMYKNKICKPYLIIQQRTATFYNNMAAHQLFRDGFAVVDPNSRRQTYFIELEAVDTFVADDVALYKIIHSGQLILECLPKFALDGTVYDESADDFYCLQSAPSDLTPGRMINRAGIEGLIDQWNAQPDRVGGNYVFEGLRYLIRGYFRFGSSGAPYLKFDRDAQNFRVNAIQSEACPIQLTVNNNRVGNFQWINAIATPIANVIRRLEPYLNSEVNRK